MKALILRRPGSLASLQVQDIPDPKLSDGEALVQLEASSLNPLDYKMALAGHPAWKYPHIPGLDGAGTVIKVGDGADPALVGRKVVFYDDLRLPGSFAQMIAVKADSLALIPDGISCLDAATLPCAGLTALCSLKYLANLQSGQTVLIQGGAGGVGGYAIQIARHMGAKIITTCSPNNFEYVRSLGADFAIDYSSDSFRDRVMELTDNSGAHVVIDVMGSHSAGIGLTCLGYGGHLICLSGLPDLSKHGSSNPATSIHDVAFGTVHASGRSKDLIEQRKQLSELIDFLATGVLQSTRSKTIGMAEIPAALEELRERHVRGKIVADMTSPIPDLEPMTYT